MSEKEGNENLINEESEEEEYQSIANEASEEEDQSIANEEDIDSLEDEDLELVDSQEDYLPEEEEELDREDLEKLLSDSGEDLIEVGGEALEPIEGEEEDQEDYLESEEGEEGVIETKEPPTEIDIRQFSKNLIEGALYASGSPLDIEELSTKLELPKKITEELINELAYEYLERNSALIIAQVGEKWQMQLKPEYTEAVSKFAKGGGIAEKYLRTLTVIALKQPILKSLLIKLRGAGAYEHVKYLIDNDLISAVKKGRTHELTTTEKYSEMFGLPKDKTELKRVMISQLGVEPEIRRED